MRLKKLPRSFYLRPTLTVAKDLLGKFLVRRLTSPPPSPGRRGSTLLVGKIVEVEAYLGENDPASHAYRGLTKRNDVMFWKGGHLYVYFTYGMHFCCNVVTEEEGKGRAVLVRAVEPVEGIEIMRKNRGGGQSGKGRSGDTVNLTNGPAKLCEAFGIRRDQNGTDLCGKEIWIAHSPKPESPNPKPRVRSSSRIGIRNGTEKKWRFCLNRNTFVSRST